MNRIPLSFCLAASVACVATVGAALPIATPAPTFGTTALGDIDALLAEAIRAGAIPEGFDTSQRTRGFHIEADDGVRDLAMIAAHASNEAGLIVGEAPVTGGSHAMIWQPGEDARDLGDLPGGTASAVARAINDIGQIVGRGRTEEGDRAFLWEEATGMRDLNTLVEAEPGVVLIDATAIDANGRIVGRAMVDGAERAFMWTPNMDELAAAEQGAQTGTLDIADISHGAKQNIVDLEAVGANSLAVGRALSEDGRDRPVAWFPGSPAIDLGDLPGGAEEGTAYGIDGMEWIVGRSGAEDGYRAFVWQADAGMIDLNDLVEEPGDVVLTAAVSIIDDGQILAYGRDGEAVHFYRLTPVVAAYEGAQIGLVAEKGVTDLQSYAISDLGEFIGPETLPILSMDDTGRVVGACDLLSTACPYLTDLADVTNFFEEEPLPPEEFFTRASAPPRSSGNGVGTQLTPNRNGGGGGGGFPSFGGGGGGGGGGDKCRGDRCDPDRPDKFPEPGPDVSVVPLPAAWFSLLAAFGLLGLLKRRRAAA